MLSRDLRYMKQRIHAGLQLNKSAKVCHAGHTSGHHIADCELLRRIIPGILIRELHAQRDLLVMNILDEYSDHISGFENLLRVLHASPGDLGNM